MQTIFITLIALSIIALIHGAVIVPIDTAYVKSDRVGNDFSYSIEENRGVLGLELQPVPIQHIEQILRAKPQVLQPLQVKDTQQTQQATPEQSKSPQLLQSVQPKAAAYVGTALHPIQSLALTAPTATYPIGYIPSAYQYAYTYPYAAAYHPIAYNLIKA